VKPPRVKRVLSTESRVPFTPLAEVAEVEPNGTPALAQSLPCENSLRPAALVNSGPDRDEDWIQFTASVGQLITFETQGDPAGPPETDTVISLFAADGTTLLISNDDAPGLSTFYSRIADFQAPYTGVYYGRIIGFNGAQGPYQANLTCAAVPIAPANDLCADAITIPYGSINVTGSTLGAHDDYDLCPGTPSCPASCTGFNSPGRDVVYRIDVVSPVTRLRVDYHLEPASVDASIYVVTDCSNIAGSCIAGQDSDLGSPNEHLTVERFPAVGTYYLILDAFNPGGATWTMSGSLEDLITPTVATTWGRLKTIYR
jgi:hypothetical protein